MQVNYLFGLKKENKKLVIDEDKKQIIIDAFEFYKETTSAYQTFQKLDLRYPELQFNYMRVYSILTNKLYAGIKETRYGDIKDFCTAIIDKDTFEYTQIMLNKNARKPNSNNAGGYIFQGLLRCAECGYTLGGKFYSKNIKSSRYYYICKRHHLSLKCNCKTNFNEQKVEQKLLSELKIQLEKYISKYDYKQKSVEKIDLSKEISSIENKLSKLKDLYIRDLIRIDEYEKDYKNYIEQLDNLYKQQKKIQKSTSKNTNTDINKLKSILSQDFYSTYNLLSRQEKRRIWLSIIDYIVIDKDYNMQLFFI